MPFRSRPSVSPATVGSGWHCQMERASSRCRLGSREHPVSFRGDSPPRCSVCGSMPPPRIFHECAEAPAAWNAHRLIPIPEVHMALIDSSREWDSPLDMNLLLTWGLLDFEGALCSGMCRYPLVSVADGFTAFPNPPSSLAEGTCQKQRGNVPQIDGTRKITWLQEECQRRNRCNLCRTSSHLIDLDNVTPLTHTLYFAGQDKLE